MREAKLYGLHLLITLICWILAYFLGQHASDIPDSYEFWTFITGLMSLTLACLGILSLIISFLINPMRDMRIQELEARIRSQKYLLEQRRNS